jgi:hypothetical protein
MRGRLCRRASRARTLVAQVPVRIGARVTIRPFDGQRVAFPGEFDLLRGNPERGFAPLPVFPCRSQACYGVPIPNP